MPLLHKQPGLLGVASLLARPRSLSSPHPLEAHGSGLEAHGSGIERAIPAELPPGEYVVTVFLTVQQSDVDYFFRVMVT
jgi:hypothetical protein